MSRPCPGRMILRLGPNIFQPYQGGLSNSSFAETTEDSVLAMFCFYENGMKADTPAVR